MTVEVWTGQYAHIGDDDTPLIPHYVESSCKVEKAFHALSRKEISVTSNARAL
jgi:hypothetical protein